MDLPTRSAGDTAFRRAAHLAVRAVGDETIVLDPRRNRVYGLDAAGGRVLELLRHPVTSAEITARWVPNGSDPELAAALATFLDELARQGVIESGAPSPPALVAGEPPASALLPGSAAPPHLLWQEDLPSVTHQVSPPHIITNPQCLP